VHVTWQKYARIALSLFGKAVGKNKRGIPKEDGHGLVQERYLHVVQTEASAASL